MNENQKELLIMLAEEAGELVQACTKALRHGLDSYNPDLPNSPTNLQNIRRELVDVMSVCAMMTEEGIEAVVEDDELLMTMVNEAVDRKQKYHHHGGQK